MNRLKWVSGAVIFATAFMASGPARQASEYNPCCSVVQQALQAVNGIQRGMKRRDLEKEFRLDGGPIFNSVAYQIYVYRPCPYIKVEVGFERVDDKGNWAMGGPNDVVKYVAHPFIDYPVMD